MTYSQRYIDELSDAIKRMKKDISMTKFNLRLAEEEMQKIITEKFQFQ